MWFQMPGVTRHLETLDKNNICVILTAHSTFYFTVLLFCCSAIQPPAPQWDRQPSFLFESLNTVIFSCTISIKIETKKDNGLKQAADPSITSHPWGFLGITSLTCDRLNCQTKLFPYSHILSSREKDFTDGGNSFIVSKNMNYKIYIFLLFIKNVPLKTW